MAKDKCSCIPWNYPSFPNETTPICTAVGAQCFEEALRSNKLRMASANCTQQCLPNCNAAQFDFTTDTVTLKVEDACYRAWLLAEDDIIKTWNRHFPKDIYECLLRMEGYLAVVTLEYHTHDVTKSYTDVSLTLSRFISILGGTIGFFTGSSVIACADLLLYNVRLNKIAIRNVFSWK